MKSEFILKIIALIILPLILGFVWYRLSPAIPHVTQTKNTLVFAAPYTNTLDANLGLIQDARIVVPMKTTNGFTNTTFLLDSGAAVSTLPMQAAGDIGVNLALSKRIALQGFSGTPTFAYLDNITLSIAGHEFTIPATFSQSPDETLYILGRKGLFDDFTVQFDKDTHTITLSRKI